MSDDKITRGHDLINDPERMARLRDDLATERLGHVLAAYEVHPTGYESWGLLADQILADPSPLFAALAEAGALTRVTDRLPPRSDPMRPRGAKGGVHWAAERYVSEWKPDSKWRTND